MEVEALKQVLPLLPKPWIEIGIGGGRFAQALGINIGLDPSSQLVKIARNRSPRVLLGQGEEAPFKDGSFGATFLIVTLCFVASAERILSEAARLLKTGGKVVLGIVLRESAWGQLHQREKETGHHSYRYAMFYTYAEVDMLLKQAGFSNEKVVSTLFQNPGEVNHIELPRQGFSADAGSAVILAGRTTA